MTEQAYVCEVCGGKVVPDPALDVRPSLVRLRVSKVLQCKKCGIIYIDFGDMWVKAKSDFTMMERTNKLSEYSEQQSG